MNRLDREEARDLTFHAAKGALERAAEHVMMVASAAPRHLQGRIAQEALGQLGRALWTEYRREMRRQMLARWKRIFARKREQKSRKTADFYALRVGDVIE
jgi:hypothetical protein